MGLKASPATHLSSKIIHWQGVLYNQQALLETCAPNHIDTSITDPELLIIAYAKWGQELPSHLDGDFSFALALHNGDIFCARDPLGIKPLYYTKNGDEFCFAADIDSLLTLQGSARKVNVESLRSMLFNRQVAYCDTMYLGIHRLPPGHFLYVKGGEIEIKRYWYPERIKIDYTISLEEAAQHVRALLKRAIEKRVQDITSTAFEVSGGLDSSSLVSLLAETNNPEKIDCYSMSFGDMTCDEGNYMESLLKRHPLHHQKIPANGLDYRKKYSLQQLYRMSPHWPITMTFAMALPMLEAMQHDGKTLVISGQGGDHLFVGSPYVLFSFFKRLKIRSLLRELSSFKNGPWKATKAFLLKPLLGPTLISLLRRIRGKTLSSPFLKETPSVPDLSTEMQISDPCLKEDIDSISSAFFTTIMDGGFCHCAEQLFGVEYRHPYLDQDLVEYVLSLPPEYKYSRGEIKRVLRQAMQGTLPETIRTRQDKAEFSPVILQQLKNIPLESLLKKSKLVKLGIIDQTLINQQLKAFEEGKQPQIGLLWLITNVEFWYRTTLIPLAP